jgi:hypothetical protein
MLKMRQIFTLVATLLVLAACNKRVLPDVKVNELPACFPDYVNVTIPSTIAPLNFKVLADYSSMQVVFDAPQGGGFYVTGKTFAKIPPKKWSNMLKLNIGETIQVSTLVRNDGKWLEYEPFSLYVAPDSIDYGLAYRLIAPGYEVYSKMGIYQRNLSNYEQTPIYENTLVPGSCVNCHSFKVTDPQFMNMHLRGPKGGTVLLVDGEMNWLHTKTDQTMSNFVYPYWHPSGNYLAYSVNDTHQVFHSNNKKRVEVFDHKSDVVVYDIRNNEALLCERLMRDDAFETFPNFSADGKSLYFCSAQAQPMPMKYEDVKYNLCRISFDPETRTFGNEIDTLFDAAAIGKSVTFPRPSPDGKYIMFTLADYGNFSIWHPEADLYLLDLQTSEVRAMDEVNSDDTESYHSWSSNSRWFVFSSRRMDGLYTRPFLAHIDALGKVSKPFLLPQKDIEHYDRLVFSFNIPEFINAPVELPVSKLEKTIHSQPKPVQVRKIK